MWGLYAVNYFFPFIFLSRDYKKSSGIHNYHSHKYSTYVIPFFPGLSDTIWKVCCDLYAVSPLFLVVLFSLPALRILSLSFEFSILITLCCGVPLFASNLFVLFGSRESVQNQGSSQLLFLPLAILCISFPAISILFVCLLVLWIMLTGVPYLYVSSSLSPQHILSWKV